MKATYSRRSAVRLMALIGAICIFASLAATTVAATTSGPAPAQVAPPTPPQAPTVPLQHNIIIQSTDGLQIAPRERKEWYQEETWPLIGSIAAVLITNTLAIALVYLQSRRSFNALLRQCKIELLSSSLNDFYNPLLALIEINGEIFAKTGPRSFPEAHYEREAAALVWKQMKTKILENNHELEIILRTKTHLMHRSDSLDGYKSLLIHVAMYETFQKIETDHYAKFRFPEEVTGHIIAKRSSALKEFHALVGEQI